MRRIKMSVDVSKLPKLGFGLMRLPSLDTAKSSNVDIEQLKKMVDLFIEKGFTYFEIKEK